MDGNQRERIGSGDGFFAALDQSGGSTPKALAEYGIDADRYHDDTTMFDLVHQMRTRVITDSAFDGSRILAAILFEQTMDREMDGLPTPTYLWERKHVVPLIKVDRGLADQTDGVQLMKPLDGLDRLLGRSVDRGMFGTKMRSVIADAHPDGIQAVVDQQLEVAAQIAAAGLVPILEPEVSIDSPHKAEAEAMLHDALRAGLQRLPDDTTYALKLTIPTEVDLYADLAADPRVLRVVALSGGYARDEACDLLRHDHAMIASFSRALLEGLRDDQSDDEFHATLDHSVAEIFGASVDKDA